MMPHCACGSVTNSSESGEPLVRVVSRGEHILLRPSSPSVVDASLLELERGILAWAGGVGGRRERVPLLGCASRTGGNISTRSATRDLGTSAMSTYE